MSVSKWLLKTGFTVFDIPGEVCENSSGFAQAWKVLEFRGLFEMSLKIKYALKITRKSLKSLEYS